MNILFTSIGKRGYLIEHFREALGGCGRVFACDASKYASALALADKAFVIPRADSRDYLPALLDICHKHDVKGVLSINDRELPFLAAIKEDLARHGVTALISEPDVIDICFDKYRTYTFLMSHGLGAPRTYLCTQTNELLADLERQRIELPIIAKPRKGSRSVGNYVIRSKDALVAAMRRTVADSTEESEKHIFQQYVDSDQFSIHMLNDVTRKPVSVVGMVNVHRHMDGESPTRRSTGMGRARRCSRRACVCRRVQVCRTMM